MEKSTKYCLSFQLILVAFFTYGQSLNCNVFRLEGDSIKFKACEKAIETVYNKRLYQFDQHFHDGLSEAIKIDPNFDYPYLEQSVAYLKSGDFISWKKLIDKAVELNSKGNLGYRAWCRYQFFRDYKGAIADIEALEKIYPTGYLGYSANGDYELHIAKALCYSAIGQKGKAISIIENQLSKKDHNVGLYDHYQLGVTYFETGKYDKALENFEKQSKVYDFAENIYFKSKVSKIRNKDYLDLKNLAIKTYDEGKTMLEGYTHHFNKVYRKQIAEL
ncbi:Tetratricopeptide repeat protein [compost metagenome]